jgi:hypothetical protein
MLMKLLKKSLEIEPNGMAASYGHLLLRATERQMSLALGR